MMIKSMNDLPKIVAQKSCKDEQKLYAPNRSRRYQQEVAKIHRSSSRKILRMNRTSKQKISKDKAELNSIINKQDILHSVAYFIQ